MPRAKSPRNGDGRTKTGASGAENNVTTRQAASSPEQTTTTQELKKHASPVPINLEEEIRRRAYELYEQRGATSGQDHEDWLVAEREVLARYQQQSA